MRAALIALVTLAAVGCEQAARTTGPQEVPNPLASYHESPGAVQIVFSGQEPPGSFLEDDILFAFWVWCDEDDAADLPYDGLCAGSILFEDFEAEDFRVRAVLGEVSEDEGIYTMVLASSDGAIVCDLENDDASLNKGPNNDVKVECSEPEVSGLFEDAVVVVTGH